MKKILLLFAALVMFTACNDDDDNFHVDRVIRDFNVESASWRFFSNPGETAEPYYVAEVRFPELDNFKYNNGTLVVYLEVESNGVKIQKPLPYVRVLQDQYGHFTRTIDYDYTNDGFISFFVKVSDMNSNDVPPRPEFMKFRAVILY